MLKSNFTSHPFKSLYFLLLFFILNMNYLRVFAISYARLLVHLSLASVFTTSNTSFVGDNMSSEYTTKTVFDVFAPFICWLTQNAQLKSRHFSGFLQHPIHYILCIKYLFQTMQPKIIAKCYQCATRYKETNWRNIIKDDTIR